MNKQETQKLIWRLGIFSAAFSFSSYLFVPLTSAYIASVLDQLTLTLPVDMWLGIIFAAYPLAIIFTMHGMGALADNIGRRNVIIIGLLLTIVSIALLLVARSPIVFMIARAMEAVGYLTVLIITFAKVNDYLREKNRGSQDGILLSLQQIGNMVAPPVGAWLSATFFPELPFLAGIVVVVLLLGMFLSTKKQHVRSTAGHAFDFVRNIKTFLGFRKLKGMAILGITMHAHSPALIIFLPLLILERFGNITYVGYAFFALAAMKPLQFLAGKLVDKEGKATMTVVGCIIVGLSLFLIPLAQSIWTLLLIMLLMSAGSALWNTGAWTVMSSIGEANHLEGHIVGTYSSISKVGDLVASLVFGCIAAMFGMAYVFSIGGYILIAGVLLSLIFLKDYPEHLIARN